MFAKIYYFCAMRFLTANYLFPLHINPIKEGVLQVSDEGEVIAIFNNRKDIPLDKLEVFEGILCPGFVNAHCHLELSHMKGKLPQKTGLPGFISEVPKQREVDISKIQLAIKNADALMQKNGIVAVGDISNTKDSFDVKRISAILYHTFAEVFATDSEKANFSFKQGLEVLNESPKPKSLVPHATYSVSKELFRLLKNHNRGEVICIHNQETKSEDELFKSGRGALYNFLKQFGKLYKTGSSALKTALEQMPKDSPILLVHNTFTKRDDVQWAQNYNDQLYWCTCPKANLYIENTLPDYTIFDVDRLCVGTDSLASNENLSILEEIKIIQDNSDFDLNTLLKIACKNGAEALGFESLGTFEMGKIPGVNLIENLDDKKLIKIV